MYARTHYFFASLLALCLVAGAAAPAAAHASSHDGTLKVYVDVENNYNYADRDPRDFDIYVGGEDVSRHFRGDDHATTLHFEGRYTVIVTNGDGYTPRYSSGCHGDLDDNDTETCRITLEGSRYGYYPNQPYYPTYASPVTYVQTYVPRFPNTGFAPVSAAAVAFAVVLLIGAGVIALPYVRKTLTSVFG